MKVEEAVSLSMNREC